MEPNRKDDRLFKKPNQHQDYV